MPLARPLLLLCLAAGAAAMAGPVAASASWISAQAPLTTPATPPTHRKTAAPAKQVAAAPAEEAAPRWAELQPAQQQALAPLAGTWKTLSEAHKRKWLALSQNYPKMSAEDQSRLHSRMSEWAALTPQQRTQARLNFAETKKVAPDDKKAKWEAYQALPDEEKRKLAAGAAAVKPPPPPTAAAVKPVPAQKLAKTPARKDSAKTPRIAVAPNQAPPNSNAVAPQPGRAPLPQN